MSLYERRNFLGGSEFGGGTRVGIVKRTLVCNMEICVNVLEKMHPQ
jgi:hypothetical protein